MNIVLISDQLTLTSKIIEGLEAYLSSESIYANIILFVPNLAGNEIPNETLDYYKQFYGNRMEVFNTINHLVDRLSILYDPNKIVLLNVNINVNAFSIFRKYLVENNIPYQLYGKSNSDDEIKNGKFVKYTNTKFNPTGYYSTIWNIDGKKEEVFWGKQLYQCNFEKNAAEKMLSLKKRKK